MKTYSIAVIGLGQRIAHVLAAMKEVGWRLRVDGRGNDYRLRPDVGSLRRGQRRQQGLTHQRL